MNKDVIITVKPEDEIFDSTKEGTRYLVPAKDLVLGTAPFLKLYNINTSLYETVFITGTVRESFLIDSKLHIHPDRRSSIVCKLQPLNDEQIRIVANKEALPNELERAYNLYTINPFADSWRKDNSFPFSVVTINSGEKLRLNVMNGVYDVTQVPVKGEDQVPFDQADLMINSIKGAITKIELQEPVSGDEDK